MITTDALRPVGLARRVASLCLLLFTLVSGFLGSPAEIKARRLPSGAALVERGIASWYRGSRRTASGERYHPDRMTAAHRTLPFGTLISVCNLKNGRSAVVRINDRGPFRKGRAIDLSQAAARRLEMLTDGVAPVELRIVASPPRTPAFFGDLVKQLPEPS
ncbi:MAG: septal ring lytic transglycosylase RlpA family protein [Candidatus Methylacidiphilaceae bacterium]